MLSSQMVQDGRGQHRAPGSEYREQVRSAPAPTFLSRSLLEPQVLTLKKT